MRHGLTYMLLVVAIAASLTPRNALAATTRAEDANSRFQCVDVQEDVDIVPNKTGAVVWWQGNCSGTTPYGDVGPFIVNMLKVDLLDDSLVLEPMTAPAPNTTTGAKGVAPLPTIMAQDERMVAGINGGYFYRTDVHHFFDDVCIGKNLKEAELPVGNGSNPNAGIGDGSIVRNGQRLGSNCNCLYGYNMPTTMVLNGSGSSVVIQEKADPPPAGAVNCLSAGPNLVSFNATSGESYVDIPKKDENVNILGKSANTGVGLQGQPGQYHTLVMLTVNGKDGCSPFDPTCGINAYPLATLMKELANCTVAMNMDQGGSTTMVIQGKGKAGRQGVVSCTPDCEGTGRNLFSGLFVGVKKKSSDKARRTK